MDLAGILGGSYSKYRFSGTGDDQWWQSWQIPFLMVLAGIIGSSVDKDQNNGYMHVARCAYGGSVTIPAQAMDLRQLTK